MSAQTGKPFTRAVVPLLLEYLDGLEDRTAKTVEHVGPDEIAKAFDRAGCGLEVEGGVIDDQALIKSLEVVLKYSVRTGSPFFLNQLFARADDASIAADWLTTATNTNAYTYEAGPVYTLLEKAVLKKFASVIGEGWEQAEGLSIPGGSIGNLYGMLLGRSFLHPEIQKKGAAGGPVLVALVSEQSHYSFLKSGKVMGLGSDNIVSVKCDELGRLRGPALKEMIAKVKAEGRVPFFVGATVGTTVMGAIDAFDEIADVCKAEKLWMHVDGCWGGSLLLSPTEKKKLVGIARADSLAWNPHKMVGATLQTCVFMTKHRTLLAATNATKAAYLFQPDKEYTDLDVGDQTIQCGRKPDLFKLWLMWQRLGDAGLAARVDKCVAMTHLFEAKVQKSAQFQAVYPSSCANFCFWWVPPQLRPFDATKTLSASDRESLHACAPAIKKEMQRLGQAMIGFQSINDQPNFFRLVFANADVWTEADVDKVMADLESAGMKHVDSLSAEPAAKLRK